MREAEGSRSTCLRPTMIRKITLIQYGEVLTVINGDGEVASGRRVDDAEAVPFPGRNGANRILGLGSPVIPAPAVEQPRVGDGDDLVEVVR
jgi:hypothetical protein